MPEFAPKRARWSSVRHGSGELPHVSLWPSRTMSHGLALLVRSQLRLRPEFDAPRIRRAKIWSLSGYGGESTSVVPIQPGGISKAFSWGPVVGSADKG